MDVPRLHGRCMHFVLNLLKETQSDKLEYTQFCFSGKIVQKTATRIEYLAPGFLGKTK